MDLFDLVAKITLDTSEYESGIDGAKEKASTFGDKLKTAGKVAAGAITAVASATAVVTTAVARGVSETAAYGDNIDKMSQKLGMSATAYQEWDAVMQHAGTSIDSMQASMKTLASAAETGNAAFEQLGITQEELSSMSQEELFANTLTALQNVEDETQRTYLAGQLLGRGATELGPLLNMTAEETQNLKDRVHEIGGVMSDEAVAAAAAYQDSLQDLQTSFGGLKRNMLSQFMPAITTVMDGLTTLFSGGDGIGQITEGINQFVGKLSETIPQMMDVGTNIIMALGDAIIENLPTLADAAIQTIMSLGTGLINALPMLVQAGLEILLSLAASIEDNLPTLIPTIVDVIIQIVNTLTEPSTLSQLITAAVAIIIALAQGLVNAIPRLLEAIPTIIANIVTALIQAIPQIISAAFQMAGGIGQGLLNGISRIVNAVGQIKTNIVNAIRNLISSATSWGRDMVQNFINGITQKFSNLRGAVSNFASTVRSFLHFSEPDVGPLKDFSTYAPDMMALFAKGIRDNEHLVTNQIEKSFDFGSALTGITGYRTNTNSGGAISGPITMNVYPSAGMDEERFAEYVAIKLNDMVIGRKAVTE